MNRPTWWERASWPESALRACRRCDSLPAARVYSDEPHRLPATWRPIEEHPVIRPGPWVPRGDMKGVVFCEACGTVWLLFLDPAHDYYTDVVELAPELCALLSEEAGLETVLPLALSADLLLQLMLRDWFALARYERGEAADALLREIARADLPAGRVLRLLDFLVAVLAGAGPAEPIRIRDVSPLLALPGRDDLRGLGSSRAASARRELERILSSVARAALGSAFGSERDRVEIPADQRTALLALAAPRESARRPAPLAPPGVAPRLQPPLAVERLLLEIEDLLRAGANRVTAQEIAPIVEVVRSFWEGDAEASPGLQLYRRCRDVLLALRHADLVPGESEDEVAAALAHA